MFDNIGQKVKAFAKGVFVTEVIAAIISGIVMICSGEDELILWGIITIIAGPLIGWLSSFLIYAFGQLVENSDILVYYAKLQNGEDVTAPVTAARVDSAGAKKVKKTKKTDENPTKAFLELLPCLTEEQLKERIADPSCSDYLRTIYQGELNRRNA